MSNISTFGAFTTARLGIFAAQKALDVTGHNITNINTPGYTRQALDQVSLRIGGHDRYQPMYAANVGSGVLCTGVSQLRDPYLDIRYRNEQASVGATDAKLVGLEELSSILDEVGKGDGSGVIEKQINDFITQLQNLNTQGTGQQEYDSLVRSSATTLVQLFNTYSDKLNQIEKNQIRSFKQDLETVDNLLVNIRNLNASIRRSEIHNDQALEQRDERNLMIDKLSQYMKIDVSYGTEDIGGGQTVEKLIIRLAGCNPNPDPDSRTDQSVLVDGIYAGQMSIKQEPVLNPDYKPADPEVGTNFKYLDADGKPTKDEALAAHRDNANYNLEFSSLTDARGKVLQYPNPDPNGAMIPSATVSFSDNDLYGSLQATREILTEKGEFSTVAEQANNPNATIKRGVPYYRNSLDALARKFAETLNEANKIPADDLYQKDASGNFLLDGNGDRIRKPGYADYSGGALFSNSGTGNDEKDITAANLSVSQGWATGSVRMLKSKSENPTSKDNTNISYIITQMSSKQAYRPNEITTGGSETVYFKGNFQDMLTNITATLANEKSTTETMLNNYSSSALELNNSRDSFSGVDLNDEAANMMQYQKSYAAACRLMTTIDEVLDKLINGTGMVGR